MKDFLCIIAACAIFVGTIADSGPGGCPNLETIHNFNVELFVGVWYEVERYQSVFGKGDDCVKFNYTLSKDEDDLPIKFVYTKVASDGDVTIHNGDAIYEDEERGKLKIRFAKLDPRDPYWLLSIDYDNYYAVSSCHALGGLHHLQNVWIFSRTTALDENVLTSLHAEIDALGLDSSKLVKSSQSCNQRQ